MTKQPVVPAYYFYPLSGAAVLLGLILIIAGVLMVNRKKAEGAKHAQAGKVGQVRTPASE